MLRLRVDLLCAYTQIDRELYAGTAWTQHVRPRVVLPSIIAGFDSMIMHLHDAMDFTILKLCKGLDRVWGR